MWKTTATIIKYVDWKDNVAEFKASRFEWIINDSDL